MNSASGIHLSPQAAVAIDKAFSKACKVDFKWNELLQSEELGNFLMNEAEKYRSRQNLVGSSLLSSVAGLLGPNTCLQPVLTKEAIMPSFFLLAVAPPGAGKSSAINQFTINPISKIAQEYKKRIISGDFTKAGLCKLLSENKGYLLLAADECTTSLKLQLGINCGEGSLRNLLNVLWDSRGYNKDFGTKERVHFEKSYFTLFGTCHPDTVVSLLQTIDSVSDGLRDRFFITVSHMRRDKAHEQEVFEAPDGWQDLLLRDIYRAHHHKLSGENEFVPKRYHLSDEASAHVNSISKEADDEVDEQWAEFDSKVAKGDNLSVADRPFATSSSKELQMGLRLSVVVHVLRSYLEQLRIGTYTGEQPLTIRHVPINEVSKKTVEESIKLVERMTQVQDHFLSVARMLQSPNLTENEPQIVINVAREILLYRGKFVTSSMLLRKLRKSNAGAIIAAMSDLSSKPGTPGCVGVYIQVARNRGTKIHVFYKPPPDVVDQAKLIEIGIDPKEYEATYQNELTEVPAGVNIGEDNWEKYVQYINVKKPRNY